MSATIGITTAVIVFIFSSLAVSNLLYKLTHNFVYSRKLAHALFGIIILLIPVLFSTPLIPVILSASVLILFLVTHQRELFYGVQRKDRFSEIYFAFSVTVCLASGWFINPWIGVSAALFLAWGDGITGLIRYPLYHTQHEKGWAGSVGMLVTCLLIALLVQPYWVGAVGAVVAMFLERQRRMDDNLAAPLGALLTMGLLS